VSLQRQINIGSNNICGISHGSDEAGKRAVVMPGTPEPTAPYCRPELIKQISESPR